MSNATTQQEKTITRQQLIERLNDDLAREYQAVIAYVVYSQVLKGAEYMSIAKELEKHAGQELTHALTISKHIDYLGGMPSVTPKTVVQSDDAREMLRADLKNESDTIRAYRERVGVRAAEHGWVEQQPVDGKVAPLHVFARGFGVADGVGVAAVGVHTVGAERCDLSDAALGHGTLFAT